MKSDDIIKRLKAEGWIKKGQKGSHAQFVHPIRQGKVTVPMHSGDISKGTLNSILKQAGLK